MVLDRVVRRDIDRHPGAPFIVSRGDIGVPHPLEVSIFISAPRRIGYVSADKTAGRASSTAPHRLVLRGILNAMADTHVGVTNPLYGRAVSFADGDMNMAFAIALVVHIAVIKCVRAINADRRVGPV